MKLGKVYIAASQLLQLASVRDDRLPLAVVISRNKKEYTMSQVRVKRGGKLRPIGEACEVRVHRLPMSLKDFPARVMTLHPHFFTACVERKIDTRKLQMNDNAVCNFGHSGAFTVSQCVQFGDEDVAGRVVIQPSNKEALNTLAVLAFYGVITGEANLSAHLKLRVIKKQLIR